MAQKKLQKRVFYTILPDKKLTVDWYLVDSNTAYGLPPSAYLDLGGYEPFAWVLVVCYGRQGCIVFEQVWYEDFYDVAPPATHQRQFRISRKDSIAIGTFWEKSRDEAVRNQERKRYSIWRAAVEKCVSTLGYFDVLP